MRHHHHVLIGRKSKIDVLELFQLAVYLRLYLRVITEFRIMHFGDALAVQIEILRHIETAIFKITEPLAERKRLRFPVVNIVLFVLALAFVVSEPIIEIHNRVVRHFPLGKHVEQQGIILAVSVG